MVKTVPSVDGMPKKINEPKDDVDLAMAKAEQMFLSLTVCFEVGDKELDEFDYRRMIGWLQDYGKGS